MADSYSTLLIERHADGYAVVTLNRPDARNAMSKAMNEALQAQLSLAQNRLGYTRLVSEISGVVTARGPEAGEMVSPGRMVIQVARDMIGIAFADPARQAQPVDNVPCRRDLGLGLRGGELRQADGG